MSNYCIKDLNKNEKPREKLMSLGANNLTDEELLALILGAGGKERSCIEISREIIKSVSGLKGLLNIELNSLTEFKNISVARACAIKATVELGLRITSKSWEETKEIIKPRDVYDLLKKDLYGKDKEFLYLLCLNSRNHLLSKDIITVGTTNETLIHPRDVFKKALYRNAVSIILAHNHPSNDQNPSSEDIKVTERLLEAGKTMGIPLIDHVIITNDSYCSLKSQGLINYKMEGGEISV